MARAVLHSLRQIFAYLCALPLGVLLGLGVMAIKPKVGVITFGPSEVVQVEIAPHVPM